MGVSIEAGNQVRRDGTELELTVEARRREGASRRSWSRYAVPADTGRRLRVARVPSPSVRHVVKVMTPFSVIDDEVSGSVRLLKVRHPMASAVLGVHAGTRTSPAVETDQSHRHARRHEESSLFCLLRVESDRQQGHTGLPSAACACSSAFGLEPEAGRAPRPRRRPRTCQGIFGGCRPHSPVLVANETC